MERHVITEQEICPRHDELLTDGEGRGDVDEIRVLYPRVSVYYDVRIGARCIIHSGCVIGGDGFGFVEGVCGERVKMPQVGTVIIEDEVEIGANCAIDRAALDATVIGAGSKLDNLVHVAHGVVLGKNCVILALVAIGGSARMGDNVIISAQCMIKDNVTIGNNVMIAAGSGIPDDVEDGAVMWGFPAVPFARAQRIYARWKQLPELFTRVRELERRLGAAAEQKPLLKPKRAPAKKSRRKK